MADTYLDAWNVSESDFPVNGETSDKLRFLLKYAVLAPSGHNTQPWLFKIVGEETQLYADRTRGLRVVDPYDRELIISCGAALLNLRIALRHFGYTAVVKTFPDPKNHDLLASVRPGDFMAATAEEHSLFRAITKRHTNRLRFEDRQIPEGVLSNLQALAAQEGAWLHIVQGEDARNTVADLIAVGDRIQGRDQRFRHELAAWIHPNRRHSLDGMPGYAFGVPDVVSYFGPLTVRTFDWSAGQAATDRQLATGSPALSVLWTDADSPSDWLSAGQALGRVLLRACSDSVWASFLNQPIEIAALRSKLSDILGIAGFPQLLARMGYGPEARPTPRRRISDVLC